MATLNTGEQGFELGTILRISLRQEASVPSQCKAAAAPSLQLVICKAQSASKLEDEVSGSAGDENLGKGAPSPS